MLRSLPCSFLTATIIAAIFGCAQPTTSSVDHADKPTLQDLQGAAVDPLAASDDLAKVFIFMRTDCPIGNRYVPELNRISDEFTKENMSFYLVYPQPSETAEEIEAHISEYGLKMVALRDPEQEFAAMVEATTMPEAAVFLHDTLVYCGRIDDRYVDFGKARPEPTSRDLQEVLLRIAAGETPEPRRTKAIGCYIEPSRGVPSP